MLKVKIVNKSSFPLPGYGTSHSSGIDLYANISSSIKILSLQRILIPTGIFVEIPEGYEAQIRPRSGLALKHGLTVLNTPGTIDSDYRGEISIILINLGNDEFLLEPGIKIAQMVFSRYERVHFIEVNELTETSRGAGGFGHTGI